MRKTALCLCVAVSGTAIFYLICRLLRLLVEVVNLFCNSQVIQKIVDFIPTNIFVISYGSGIFWLIDVILMLFACSMALGIFDQLKK